MLPGGCKQGPQSNLEMLGGSGDDSQFPAAVAVGLYNPAHALTNTCSGVFISDHLLLTSAHCVADNAPVASISFSADFSTLKNGGTASTSSWVINPSYVAGSAMTDALKNDILVAVFPAGTFTGAAAAVSASAAQVNDTITMVGYGGTGVDPNNINSYVNVGQRKVGSNVVTEIIANISNAIAWARSAAGGSAGEPAGIVQGDSGGPVYNSQGALVGVMRGLVLNDDNAGGKTLYSYAVNLLDPGIAAFVSAQTGVTGSPVSSTNPNGSTTPSTDPSAGGTPGGATTGANGYPYCTNGSDTGGGYGWDESVIDPKGTHSCLVPGGATTSVSSGGTAVSSVSIGGNTATSVSVGGGATGPNGYPYCTNGSYTGKGYGWDISVIDPNGSHSCLVP